MKLTAEQARAITEEKSTYEAAIEQLELAIEKAAKNRQSELELTMIIPNYTGPNDDNIITSKVIEELRSAGYIVNQSHRELKGPYLKIQW